MVSAADVVSSMTDQRPRRRLYARSQMAAIPGADLQASTSDVIELE